jgi:prolyl oligopeptidase
MNQRARRSIVLLAPLTLLTLPALLAACGGDEPVAKSPPPVMSAPPPVVSAAPSATAVAPQGPRPPIAAKKTVTHEYFGVSVKDDYEWLEDPKDPAVKQWSQEETSYTRAVLDAWPERARARARASELLTQRSSSFEGLLNAGGTWFALKNAPPKQQALLVTLGSLDDAKTERIVLDPNALDTTGGTTIDWFSPSRDGKLVAVSLSTGGSERGDLFIYDVATGKVHDDKVTHVHNGTAGGSASWNKDGTGFYYTRYPRESERPKADTEFYQQVYFHKLGTTEDKDTYVLGKELPRIAEIVLFTSPDGGAVLAAVANGDGGEVEHFVIGADGKPTQLSRFEDKWADALFGADNALYVLSRADAPRGKILRLARPYAASAARAQKGTEVIVPQGDGTIEQFTATAHTLYVGELLGGPSRLRAYALGGPAGKAVPQEIALPKVSSVAEVVRSNAGDDLWYRAQSYTEPPAYYRWDAKKKTAVKTALFQTTPAKMDDVDVSRETCTSKDGTKIPINILRKKSAQQDGSNPTMLMGYGGYAVSRKPRFRAISRLFLDAGGIVAEANIRGGGEFGEEWHTAGNLTKKQNVFDDFYACETYLVTSKWTSPEKLAIMGGSNGGLLMGATLTQHPEAARAVVSLVGIYDMLRVELSPNGAFNVTEFGTVKKEPEFKALFAYSPFHNTKDVATYPSVLMLTGANDPRVDPYHSRKFTARLQEAAMTSGNKRPVLLRTSDATGHGIGTPLAAEIEEDADIYGFLLHELGAKL